ncbi:MAG: hypothetical protein U9N06_01820 [candidate division WOR-3 bacterium]|nr:hypothetical protein [candidate division WOR-3 bacterium]
MAHKIDYYLQKVVEEGGSDLHLKVGEPPILRAQGKLIRLKEYERFTPEEVRELIFSIMTEEQKIVLKRNLKLIFPTSYQVLHDSE